MIFGQNRQELRQMYSDAWRKSLDGTPLTPLEAQIAAVIEQHPEYQSALGEEDLDGHARRLLPRHGGGLSGIRLSVRDQDLAGRQHHDEAEDRDDQNLDEGEPPTIHCITCHWTRPWWPPCDSGDEQSRSRVQSHLHGKYRRLFHVP